MNKENQDITKSLLDVDLDAIVEAGQKKETKQKKKKRYIIGISGVLCLVVVLALLYVRVIVPTSQYNDAVELVKQGNYQAAIDGFEALGDYKNSVDMVFDTKYKWAEKLLADKAYDEAYDKFKEIESYSDAANRMNDVRYAEAEAYTTEENLGAALELFSALGDYRDAKTRAAEVYEMMQIHATSVKLNKTSLSISEGKTAELSVTMEPEDTTDTIVSWTSSDEKVATVDKNGVVSAVGSGTATIEVETSNGLTATCEVLIENSSLTTEQAKANNINSRNDTAEELSGQKSLPTHDYSKVKGYTICPSVPDFGSIWGIKEDYFEDRTEQTFPNYWIQYKWDSIGDSKSMCDTVYFKILEDWGFVRTSVETYPFGSMYGYKNADDSIHVTYSNTTNTAGVTIYFHD